MSTHPEVNQYAQKPHLLIELCHDVIEQLQEEINKPEVRGLQTQLNVISRSIEKLERMKVGVPETLRSEKIRLTATLDTPISARNLLLQLTGGLKSVLDNMKIVSEYRGAQYVSDRHRIPRTRVTADQIDQIRRLRFERHPWEEIDKVVFNRSGSNGSKSMNIARQYGLPTE